MNRWLACIAAVTTLAACAGSEDNKSLDPNAQYMLAVSSASIKANNNGTNWDPDASAPDVYVTFDGAKTTTVQDSYTPTWNPAQGVVYSVAKLKAAGVAPVVVQVLDEDLLVDDPITAEYTLTLSDDQIRAGSVTWTNLDGAQSVTFVIIPQ